MDEAIKRIRKMERLFDEARAAFAAGADMRSLKEQIGVLEGYMSGGQWLADYALDERGLLPPGLKRGVLSQDALYDLLETITTEERTR